MQEQKVLRVLQYNLHRRLNAVQTPFLSDRRVQEADIIAVQEQARNRAGKTWCPSVLPFHVVEAPGQSSRTAVYLNKRLDPTGWEIARADPDLVSIRLRIQAAGAEQKVITVHNVYNPSPVSTTSTDSPSTLPSLRNALEEPGEHIVVGDFNLHHPYWGGVTCLGRHAASDTLLELAAGAGLQLLLPAGTITREQGPQRTTIDLSWGTGGIANRLRSCDIKLELHQGSDHKPVMTEIDVCGNVALEVSKKRRNWKETDTGKLQKLLQEYLPPARDLRGAGEIQAYTGDIISALQKSVDEAVPWSKPSERSVPFWTKGCSESVAQARRRRKEWRTQALRSGEWALETRDKWKAYTKATDEKGKTIKKAKTAHWRRMMHEAGETGSHWRLAKWARTKMDGPRDQPQFPPLKRPGGEGEATTLEEKAEILHQKFFPEPRPADLEDIEGFEYPAEHQAESRVTEEEVQAAIKRTAPDKAPGASGIPNRILKAGLKAIVPAATRLFNACVTQGYHPTQFKEAITIALRKPNRADYTEAKAYRPIALLDTLGKILESIMAKRLSDLAEDNNLLPACQHGARRRRNAESALELLTEQVHTIWASEGYVATLLSLDVEGAFDFVSHARLLHNMRAKGVPSSLVEWTRSFLQDRMATLVIDGKAMAKRRVNTGIPQGSPVSPILYLFFNTPLLEACERLGIKVTPMGFADDVGLLAYSRSTEENCEMLTQAHDSCAQWARRHGSCFAPQKYELIHLSRTPRRFNMAATIDISGNEIAPKPDIRILGVQIDTKLRWGAHLRAVEAKAARQLLALNMVGASTWGVTFAKARQVYSAVVRSAITFAAPVWHQRSPGGKLKGKEKRLEVLQNQALRNVAGSFKRVSTRTLEAETYTAPIGIYMNRLQDKAALRQRDTGRTAEIRQRCALIRGKIEGRSRAATGTPATPGERKLAAAAAAVNEAKQKTQDSELNDKKAINIFHKEDWQRRWEGYVAGIAPAMRTPAQADSLGPKRIKLRAGLAKAESTLATHIRTERIGLADYLARRRVPGFESPACSCGWEHQTAKHIIAHCPTTEELRREIWEAGKTPDYRSLVTKASGLRLAARLLMKTGLLGQFSLARTLLYDG